MHTHDPQCAYGVLYRCERCGTLSLRRRKLERAACPIDEDG